MSVTHRVPNISWLASRENPVELGTLSLSRLPTKCSAPKQGAPDRSPIFSGHVPTSWNVETSRIDWRGVSGTIKIETRKNAKILISLARCTEHVDRTPTFVALERLILFSMSPLHEMSHRETWSFEYFFQLDFMTNLKPIFPRRKFRETL